MQVVDIVMVVVALAVVAGSVAFGLRLSEGSAEALRERVTTTNALLRALAARHGLAFREQAPFRHPLVGDIPNYAAATGAYRGHAVRIEVEADEDSRQIVVSVGADAARPWPDLGVLKPGRDRDGHPHLAPLLAALDSRAEEVRVTPTALRVVPKASSDGSYEAGELAAAVDAAVALAEALGHAARPR